MRALIPIVAISALILASCGGGSISPDVATAVPTVAPAVSPAAQATAMPTVKAVDVAATARQFLGALPDKYWGIGTVAAFKEAQAAGAYVIDIREPNEYEAGHIPGAVNIPLRKLTSSLDKIPQDRQVAIHCRSSYRAGIATAALQMLGYANVRDFVPAMLGWEAAKEPLSKDPVATQTFAQPKADAALIAAVDRWLSALPTDLYGAGTLAQFKEAKAAGTMMVVDVREPSEYKDGHIPGAMNIPIRDLASASLPKDKLVAVYCSANHRAGMSLTALHLMGFTNARVFGTNFAGWRTAGEPIEK